MPIITDPEGIDPIDPDNPPSARGKAAEEHRCKVCGPTRDRLEAELEATGRSWLSFVVDLLERTLCVGKDPALPDRFGPGGVARDLFLQERRIVACTPCQPVADLITSYRLEARGLRALDQEDALEGRDPYNYRDRSEMPTAMADELELVLANCIRTRCPGAELDQWAEAILAAVDTPFAAPLGDHGDEQDGPTHTPPPPVPVGAGNPPPEASSAAGPNDVGFHHGGGEVELIEPEPQPDEHHPTVLDHVSRTASLASMPALVWITLGAFALVVVIASGWWFLLRDRGAEVAGTPTATLQAVDQDEPVTAAEDAADEVASEGEAAAEFAASDAMTSLGATAASFGVDQTEGQACILKGLVDRGTTQAEYEAMANPDVSTWPPGLAEAKAGILEDCIMLRPYYTRWFGSFEFQDEACVGIMTEHVLANWSWLRFLEMGILDPELRPQLDAQFAAFVTTGYGEKGCFAASG